MAAEIADLAAAEAADLALSTNSKSRNDLRGSPAGNGGAFVLSRPLPLTGDASHYKRAIRTQSGETYMKALLTISFAVFAASLATAHAQTIPVAGQNEAAAVCGKATFSSDVDRCMRIVRSATFFDVNAVNACGGMTFSNEFADCIDAVKDRDYLPAEVKACSSRSFGSEKVSCFKSSGAAHVDTPVYEPRPNTDQYILDSLKRIESQIRGGKIPGALSDLAKLIRFVSDGMKRPD